MSLSLYPHVGTLGTNAGRTAILLPPFSGEWSALPPLLLYGGDTFLLPDPTDPFGGGDSFPVPDPTDPFGGGDSGLVA